MTNINIRDSRPTDAAELRRLAALDSATVPHGELLVAEEDGRVVAAYSPDDARAIADPFRHTADVVDMLRVRSARDRLPRRSAAPAQPPQHSPGRLGVPDGTPLRTEWPVGRAPAVALAAGVASLPRATPAAVGGSGRPSPGPERLAGPSPRQLHVWIALGIIYIVWGSTYLAIRVMVETMPPLLGAGVRFLVAGRPDARVLALLRGCGPSARPAASWPARP